MKKFFCENCGFRLNPEDRFCENCGQPVFTDAGGNAKKAFDAPAFLSGSSRLPQKDLPVAALGTEDKDFISFFSREDWESRWREAARLYGHENLGIILINPEAMSEDDEEGRLSSSTLDDFIFFLIKYVAFRREQGIYYFVLDVATQGVLRLNGNSVSAQNIIDILQKIYRVAKPKYLLLIGDEDVVDSVVWENEMYIAPDNVSVFDEGLGDVDRVVNSDLPYFTFDLTSPWSGQSWQDYSFGACVRVGRIPCHSYEGAIAYLDCVMGFGGDQELISFALSAQTWAETSETIFSPLGRKVYTSPAKTANDFMAGALKDFCGGQEPNLLFFNLHGSPNVNYWIGEGKEGVTMAFDADCLPFVRIGYVIGTEACYGAKPADEESLLCTALQNGCIAFLGSTQIAYGACDGECSCADVLVGEWIKKVAEKYTVGDAYVAALIKLCQSELDLEEIKTLAEFSLYGDPSLSLLCAKPSVLKSLLKKAVPLQKGIHIPMPDIRRAIGLELAKVTDEIQSKLNSYIEKYHMDFAGTSPCFYAVKGRNEYQAVYSKNSGVLSKTMKIYFDKRGNVGKVYFSK